MIFGVALEVLRKDYGCKTTIGCGSLGNLCDRCEYDVDADTVTEALKTVLDTFDKCSELPNSSADCVSRQAGLIDRAEAQTELQFAARRYTVAHEAHGEGRVVWSENLISVTDAMNALRKVPSVQDKQKKWTAINKDDPATFPNECDWVWVTGKNNDVDIFQLSNKGYWIDRDQDYVADFNWVTAWMPFEFPEPYRGDTE